MGWDGMGWDGRVWAAAGTVSHLSAGAADRLPVSVYGM